MSFKFVSLSYLKFIIINLPINITKSGISEPINTSQSILQSKTLYITYHFNGNFIFTSSPQTKTKQHQNLINHGPSKTKSAPKVFISKPMSFKFVSSSYFKFIITNSPINYTKLNISKPNKT